MRGDLRSAEDFLSAALVTIRAFDEPRQEATIWHQLGMVLQKAQRWTEAEAAYRESAQLSEKAGELLHATKSWGHIAQLMTERGHWIEAEKWYKKTLDACRAGGDIVGTARTLGNLATLLRDQPDRINEARALAEQALTVMKTVDTVAAETWKIYHLLAYFSEQEGLFTAARDWRRQARDSFAMAPISRETLRSQWPLITAVLHVYAAPYRRPELEIILEKWAQQGWIDLILALRRVLDGTRDVDLLCEDLDYRDSLVVATTLHAIDDPSVLESFLPQTEK